jgi:hypothetical protein
MVAPAGQFQAIVFEFTGFAAYGFNVKIGPLAGE